MSLSDALHQFLTGQSPADRARHEEVRKDLKSKMQRSIKRIEEELDLHDLVRDPKRNRNAPKRLTSQDHRERRILVNDLEYAREELRRLS